MTPSRSWRSLVAVIAMSVVAALAPLPTAAANPESHHSGAAGSEVQAWIPTGDFASSSFVRVDRQAPELIPVDPNRQLELSAVAGGHVSAQLAVTGPHALKRMRATVSALVAPGVGVLTGHVQTRYPEYISNGDGGVVADPLRDADWVNVPAGEVQPVWFTLEIPRNASAGTYQGHIVLDASQTRPIKYDLTVRVADVTLPDPMQRNFDLNMWFEPDAIADQLGVPLWSDQHFEALQPYLRDLAEHGQRVINTAAIEDPWPRRLSDGTWRAQTYVPYHSLVDWAYDGENWAFDFARWDRFVEEALAAGVGPRISVFGLVGFKGNNHLVYTDTRTDVLVDERLDLGGEQWTKAWSAFLVALENHARDHGWLDQTHLAFDERPATEMETAFALVKNVAPTLAAQKFAIAGDEGADAYAQDLSLNYSSVDSWSQDLIEQRRADGKLTTFYTWNEPVTPNTLIESPPFGARVLPWVGAQHNLDGYLRWSYNSWPKDPFTEPSFMSEMFSSNYRPGDEYIVYPGQTGPVSSIRWELFRDGQEDYALLDQLARAAGADNSTRQWALRQVQPDAYPDGEAYESLLSARAAVIAELERVAATESPR